MRAHEFIVEFIDQSQLDKVEEFCNILWNKLGIDIEFSKHFLERLNDPRNGKEITSGELIRLFRKEYEMNGKFISDYSSDAEAILTDVITNINIPFVVVDNKLDRTLVAKTVMRKSNFKSTSPIFKIR